MLNAHGVRHSSASWPSANTLALGSESKRISISGATGGDRRGGRGSSARLGGCALGDRCEGVARRPAYHSASPMPAAIATTPPSDHIHGVAARPAAAAMFATLGIGETCTL